MSLKRQQALQEAVGDVAAGASYCLFKSVLCLFKSIKASYTNSLRPHTLVASYCLFKSVLCLFKSI
jgi:hypothetical protein